MEAGRGRREGYRSAAVPSCVSLMLLIVDTNAFKGKLRAAVGETALLSLSTTSVVGTDGAASPLGAPPMEKPAGVVAG